MIARAVFQIAMLSLIAAAPDGGRYGDTLLVQGVRRWGGATLRIEAQGKDDAPIVVGPAIAEGTSVPLDDAMGKPTAC